jgi:hypothetical protein
MRFNYLLSVTAALSILTACGDSGRTAPPSATGTPGTTTPASNDAKPTVSARSLSPEFGPEGLFTAKAPGWHAVRPPKYPEMLSIDFGAPREVRIVGLLAQVGQPKRSPKALRIETSDDGAAWIPVAGSDDACTPNVKGGWHDIQFVRPAKGRYLRLVVFSNCGDGELLTLLGLRVQ